jgi:ATP-dependent Clp protease ATP-binding subunit ClpC
VFERFTERARQVVVLAQDEARLLRHGYIGTEHLLLGLFREEEGIAARVLESFATVEEVRGQVVRIVGQGNGVTSGQIPFTPRAKQVLELALREALSIGHNYIGTEHVLLGLARENDGVAMQILRDFDADAEKIREAVLGVLSGSGRQREQIGVARLGRLPERPRVEERLRGPLYAAIACAGAAFPLGLLVGWLVWA